MLKFTKLNKQHYITTDGEKKVNCYHLTISKELLRHANIEGDDKLMVYTQGNKIIIEKH